MTKLLKIQIKFLLKKIILIFIKFIYLINNKNIDKFERLLRYMLQYISNFKVQSVAISNLRKSKILSKRDNEINDKKLSGREKFFSKEDIEAINARKNREIISKRDNEIFNLFKLQFQNKEFCEATQTISWLKNRKLESMKNNINPQQLREVFEISDDADLYQKFTDTKLDFLKPLSCVDSSNLKSVDYIETAPAENVTGSSIMSGFPDIDSSEENKKKATTYPKGGLIVKNCIVFPRSTSIYTSEGELINDKASNNLSQQNIIIVEKPIIAHFSKGLAINKKSIRPTLNLDKAIHLLINNSRGWGHWHYFNLPRIEFILNLKVSKEVPILIDKNLPIQAMQSINLYLPGHKVFEVDFNDRVQVNELYFPRETSYLPGLLKINADRKKINSAITTSPLSLKFLRSVARKKAKKNKMINKHLYLSRKNTKRRFLVNREFLDDVAFKNNFIEIILEELDFETQISSTVFSKKILGQLGSATDYVINQDEKSKSLIILGQDSKTWSRTDSIIKSFGIDCRYLLAENNFERFNEDFGNVEKEAICDLEINEENTHNALKWLVQ